MFSFRSCRLWIVVVLSAFVLLPFAAGAEDLKLPAPKTFGGAGVFDMLNKRASASGGNFPQGSITKEELSTLLWAASGLNRSGAGWTIPLSMGRDPYCKIYVTGKEGTFLYSWKEHVLKDISKHDLRGKVGGANFAGFVANAPYVLIFVTDGKALKTFSNPRAPEWGPVAVGAMTQNVYLAAEALGIGVRYVASLRDEVVRKELKLDKSDTPICLMPMGKK